MVSITLAALTFPRCYSWYPLQAGSTWKCRSTYFVQFRPAAYGSHQPVVTSCNVGNRVSQLGYLLASVCWNLSKTFSPPMVFATVKFWMQKLIQTQWEMSASLSAFHKSNRSNTYIKKPTSDLMNIFNNWAVLSKPMVQLRGEQTMNLLVTIQQFLFRQQWQTSKRYYCLINHRKSQIGCDCNVP